MYETDKTFLKYSMFFHHGFTRPPLSRHIFKKSPAQIGLIISLVTKQSATKFGRKLVENHQRLHHKFVEYCIDQKHILMKKDQQKTFLESCIN